MAVVLTDAWRFEEAGAIVTDVAHILTRCMLDGLDGDGAIAAVAKCVPFTSPSLDGKAECIGCLGVDICPQQSLGPALKVFV